MAEILGVDIWGTIRNLKTYEGEMIPDAFSALKQLVDKRFGKKVWLVSAAAGEGSLHWLKEQNFYEETGVLSEHVKICRIWEKARLYDELGVTHIIDDSDYILIRLNTANYRYLFQTKYSLEVVTPEDTLKLKGIQIVTSWREILSILLPKEAE